jgi:DNA-binding CsgD family transcriptional regulator
MDDRASLSRLTEREKLCLRQWLQHKSAKEIAADLGISHHAVEKRLKMARTKLGATSNRTSARRRSFCAPTSDFTGSFHLGLIGLTAATGAPRARVGGRTVATPPERRPYRTRV